MNVARMFLVSFFAGTVSAAAFAGLGPCVLAPDQIDPVLIDIRCNENLGCLGNLLLSPPTKKCAGLNYDCPEFQRPSIVSYLAIEVPALYGIGACVDPETGDSWNCVPDFSNPTYGVAIKTCY